VWGPTNEEPVVPTEPGPGQTRTETEGVFVIRDGRAVFVPVRTGIVGERHFEVPSGVGAGDRIITGPFDTVRRLADGEAVTIMDNGAAAQ
jgi:HlyD family secretion protein